MLILSLYHLHINLHQRAPTFHAKAEANCRRGTISILDRLVVGTGRTILILFPQPQVSFSPLPLVFLKSILSKNQTINLSSPKKKHAPQNANWNHVRFHESWVSMSFFFWTVPSYQPWCKTGFKQPETSQPQRPAMFPNLPRGRGVVMYLGFPLGFWTIHPSLMYIFYM